MKFKYTGDQDEVTVREVSFPRGKAVSVDDPALAEKLSGMPYFTLVKRNVKNKA